MYFLLEFVVIALVELSTSEVYMNSPRDDEAALRQVERGKLEDFRCFVTKKLLIWICQIWILCLTSEQLLQAGVVHPRAIIFEQ